MADLGLSAKKLVRIPILDWLDQRKNPAICGASSHSGGGIRTRDLQVMSCIDRGAVTCLWLYRARSGPPRSLQIRSDWYENWYEANRSAGLGKRDDADTKPSVIAHQAVGVRSGLIAP